jgi:hypothetical protein
MHQIESQEMSSEFYECWQAAGRHLNSQVQDGIQAWLRAHPYPPFLEHLSFRLGNQLFFVRIEDVDGNVAGPGSLRGLQMVASSNNGRACLMPMKKRLGRGWEPQAGGWGLLDAGTKAPIEPLALVTDAKVEMSEGEVHDMAVQVVRGYLEKEGHELMSWQGNPEVDPAIWFIGKSGRPEWVVVRAVRFPGNQAQRPDNWAAIKQSCSRLSNTGHFASVALVSVDQPFKSATEPPVPLWRGHGMHIRFVGLE